MTDRDWTGSKVTINSKDWTGSRTTTNTKDWTGNRATTNTKDWTGNKATTFKIIGASNHCTDEREPNDFYATDSSAIDHLMAIKPSAIGGIELTGPVWEPACGQGHLSERLKQYGYGGILDRPD